MLIYIPTLINHLASSNLLAPDSRDPIPLTSNTRPPPTSLSRSPRTQHFSSHTCLVWKNTQFGSWWSGVASRIGSCYFWEYLVAICFLHHFFASNTSRCIIIFFLISFVTLGATTKLLGFRVHKIRGKHGWEKNLLYLRIGFFVFGCAYRLAFQHSVIWFTPSERTERERLFGSLSLASSRICQLAFVLA